MSQWSEKIPKENLSKTVSPTRYLLTKKSETWIQINNFRKSSKKFIIDLLTKNIALNLSGAIFFVGLGYSLKWWYKDQLFVVLLKQNLPALSESQQNRETGKYILNDEYQTLCSAKPLIDRIDLDANHVCIKFKQPWQKYFYEQLIGVFGEPAQVNISKQILTIPFTREKDWWKEDSSVSNNLTAYPQFRVRKKPYVNSFRYPLGVKGSERSSATLKGSVAELRRGAKELPDELKKNIVVTKRNFANKRDSSFSYNSTSPLPGLKKSCDSKRNLVNKFSPYTLYTHTQKKPIFPKKLFKLSPHNLCFLNQNSIPCKGIGVSPAGVRGIPTEFLLNTKQRNLFSKAWALSASARFCPIQIMQIENLPDLQGASHASARVYSLQPLFGARAVTRVNWKLWRSKAAKEKDSSPPLGRNLTFSDKFSYPLQLTKELTGWQPFPNLLVLNSYLDEIPYKLENALQSYFPRKNEQLLVLSTSFRQSINSRNKFLISDRSQAVNNSYNSRKNSEGIVLRNDFFSKRNTFNKVVIKSNSVNTLLCKASPSNPSILHTFTQKVFTHYLPLQDLLYKSDKWKSLYPLQIEDLHGVSCATICNSWQNKEGLLPDVLLWGQEQKSQKLTEEQLLCKQEEPIANSDANDENLRFAIPFVSADAALPFGKVGEILPQHEKLAIKELEAEGVGVKAPRGLLYKSTNSWVSGAFANYKNSETENNETEKTLDLFKEMFLVPGKQNEQSETYLKKLHLFETKKLLQNQLTSLINSFPIDLVEKSKAIVEKDNALQILLTPYGVRGYIEDLHHLGNNVVNVVNNKSNFFEMNGGLLNVSKKILEVKRKTLKKAMDPGVKGQYLPGLLYKSLMYDSCSFQYPCEAQGKSKEGTTNGSAAELRLPLGGTRSQADVNDSATSALRFARFVPKESVAESYWDTEIYRLTQLFAYSTVAELRTVGDAKGSTLRYPLLLLNTLGFTFNNLSPLTNPPIFSSSENKINVIDKDINFDKNSRYMSGYIYPDIESNSLKVFLYPWLGKNKNLMLSPRAIAREYKYHYYYLNDKFIAPTLRYSKNLESNYTHHDSLFQQHNDNLLLSHEDNSVEDQLVRQQEEPSTNVANRRFARGMQQENERYAKREYNSLTQCSVRSSAALPFAKEQIHSSTLDGGVNTIPLPSARVIPYKTDSSLIRNKEKNGSSGNSHYMGNIEIPYKKFNHYLAKFPGFSDPTQFLTTLPQIACGNENLVNESSILGKPNFVLQRRGTKKTHSSKINLDLFETEEKIEHVNPLQIEDLHKVSEHISTNNIVDKLEINKKFIQKNGCNSRKTAYSGIVVRRNKKTKDFQPFNFKNPRPLSKELNFLLTGNAASAKSSIWGTLFLGPENPLTNRQCHFFGQKQLSTLDTKSLQRNYLRELGKEILTQSNLKGYTELSKFASIERTKILSLSKKVNSFFFKKRKYSYLLEPKDQWHLLFQEQLCSALEDCKKYPLSTIYSFEETSMAKLDSGRIKVSAPLVMARFPKKLVQFRSIHDTQCEAKGYVSLTPSFALPFQGVRSWEESPLPSAKLKDIAELNFVRSSALQRVSEAQGYKLEQGISWRPFCNLQRSFIYTPLKDNSLTQCFAPKSPICNPFVRSSAILAPSASARVIPPYEVQLRLFLSRYVSSSWLGVPPATHALPGYSGAYELWGNRSSATLVSPKSAIRELVQQEYRHYPLFTERFSEEINALPYLNKNSLFYSATDSSAVTNSSPASTFAPIPNFKSWLGVPRAKLWGNRSSAALPFVTDTQENMNKRSVRRIVSTKNNLGALHGVQNMCNSLLIQEPLNCNSWAVLNQWVFLIALLYWIEQTLLDHVFPALFALEQILLSAAGLRTGENNRTHVLRISKNETPKFQNLAGIDGLLGELSELVLFLRGQRNIGVAKLSFWNKWNKKNSYGVLLTGSPGTGKTFLVRALANEANVPVLILSASTLTASKLNNNKPSWSIRHAFKRAKQLAPCILFIDEIDALGKSRGKIVTDINEIVADSAASALISPSHKRIFTKSTHNNSASLQQMFSYEQFGQNSSNFNATLLNKWEYPLQSTILQESNEINQNSLCQEKLVDLLKIAGGGSASIRNKHSVGETSYPLDPSRVRGMELGTIESTLSAKESAAEFKESTSSDIDNKGVLPTLEKEMTRGKFGPLTQLLVSMDGVSSFSGVLIMGATNRPELLDPALTRPGRFEKTIRIDKPSEQNRIEILQLYSQNLGVQQQIPWSYLATRTIGLTTADLAVAMNYSSLRAIIQNSVHTLETIEYGLNCITRL